MGFGEKLYSLRDQAKMSQIQLAEALDVSRQTISKWELGVTFPEVEKLLKISEIFHVSTDFLLKETKAPEEGMSLDRLVLKFLGSAQDMDVIAKELVDVMRDGIIDQNERIRVDAIIDTLDSIAVIIDEIKQNLHYRE